MRPYSICHAKALSRAPELVLIETMVAIWPLKSWPNFRLFETVSQI